MGKTMFMLAVILKKTRSHKGGGAEMQLRVARRDVCVAVVVDYASRFHLALIGNQVLRQSAHRNGFATSCHVAQDESPSHQLLTQVFKQKAKFFHSSTRKHPGENQVFKREQLTLTHIHFSTLDVSLGHRAHLSAHTFVVGEVIPNTLVDLVQVHHHVPRIRCHCRMPPTRTKRCTKFSTLRSLFQPTRLRAR